MTEVLEPGLTRDDRPAFRFYLESELGKDGYPPEWHATIKHEVRDQAGERCVRCLHPYVKGSGEWSACDTRCIHDGPMRVRNDDGALIASIVNGTADWHVHAMLARGWTREARWRILTVHHLDGDKANCRWFNLCALCQRCHLQVQGKVVMERAFIFEHSAWFKPYAAGWYALKYEDREITRQEAEADLDRLLALERLA